MKRALLAVVLLCVVVLASCVPSQEEPYKVLLILRSWSSEASVDITRGANAAARKCGIALTTKAVTEKDEAYQQAELLRGAAGNGFDAVVIEPVNAGALDNAVQDARGKGLPVISINSREQIGQSSTVDIDEDQMADAVVSQIRATVGDNARVMMLNCLDAYDNTQRLNMILTEKMDATPGMTWDNIDFFIDDYAGIANSLIYSIPKERDSLVILALNDYATTVAVNCLKGFDKGSEITLLTFSKNTLAISQLEKGWVDGICINQYIEMGYRAVEQACTAANGAEIPDSVMIPATFVDRENLFDTDIQKLIFPVS